MDFQAGDEVQECEEGPKMTVLWCSADQVYCAWFEGSTLVNALFGRQELQLLPAAD
jgi:uncharacterized protein YodC (DUF2158 family)